MGRIWGGSMTEKAVWHVVKECAKRIGVAKLAPHDLRRARNCARLLGVSSIKSSSCRGTSLFKRQSAIWAPTSKMKRLAAKSETARLQELLTCSIVAFGPSLLKGEILCHIPQRCTQCANACQGADGPISRVSCPITIKNKLPHIVAR